MAAVLGECGKDRADAAISYCENVSHTITVDRSNTKDLKHFPSGQTAPQAAGPDGPGRVMGGPEKSPIPPSGRATRATQGGDGKEASATPATPISSTGNDSTKGVAEASATRQKTPATPATPGQSPADDQTEADSSVLVELDEATWRDAGRARGWPETRAGRARALAKDRVSRARADAVSLNHAQARGEEPRAWATERGWDDPRIHAAMRFVDPPPPQDDDD